MLVDCSGTSLAKYDHFWDLCYVSLLRSCATETLASLQGILGKDRKVPPFSVIAIPLIWVSASLN